MTNKTKRLWQMDKATYDQLQQLKEFAAFVASFDITTPEQKANAKKICRLIETIDQPDLQLHWNVCLDIFDKDLQNGINAENEFENSGVYWRSWNVFFEADMLQIKATSEHTRYNDDQYTGQWYYNGGYFVHQVKDCKNTYLDEPLCLFIEDAKNYQSYMTETLNTIEVSIDIMRIT